MPDLRESDLMPNRVDELYGTTARGLGPLAAGHYRVVVLESDLRTTSHDFADLDEAKTYADDTVSETDDSPPIAHVFDDGFAIVHRGRPYWVG